MSFIDRIVARLTGTEEQEKRGLSLTDYQQWVDLGIANPSASGVSVTPGTALTATAVYACVRILSETVASLPLVIYERLERGKRRAPKHYLYGLLHDSPNEFMTSFEYRETLQAHLALWGNAYSEIEYDAGGKVLALWPLRPDRMIQVIREGDQRLYNYQLPNGKAVWLTGNNVWHLRGLGGDGLNGYSPITLMRQAIGLGKAAEEFGARLFGNDARPGGILSHPGHLGKEAADRLAGSWASHHGGLSKSHRTAVLEEGMTYDQIGIPPEDAQFLETRRFQVQEIARIYRIPPHMLADLERATFSNIEHQSIDFVVHTMRPWLVRWEQSIQKNLLLPAERDRYFGEFLVDGLLRGDTKTRYEAYSIGRQNGWFSANDIRELENLNPLPGKTGDQYLIPLNMIPAGTSAAPAPAQNGGAARAQKENRADPTFGRHRLIREYVPLFEDAAGRYVRREVSDVKRAAKKFLKNDDLAGFMIWAEDFYQDLKPFITKSLAPTVQAYSAAITRAIQRETGEPDTEPTAAGVDRFIDEYLSLYGVRYTENQKALLTGAISRARDEGEDILEVVNWQMDQWDETRPPLEARRESHRANNALALVVYGALGVSVKRWATQGDTCPYCKKLDGRKVEINKFFMPAGATIEADGQDPLPVTINLGHPPAHDGCDCMIVSG